VLSPFELFRLQTPVSRFILRVAQPTDEAAPHAAIRRCPALREFSSAFTYFGESQTRSGAHNLAIAPRLASVGALSDNMMLAASNGCYGRSTRKLTRLRQGCGGLRPACGKTTAGKQVRALLSGRIADARRGTKGDTRTLKAIPNPHLHAA
jgi:hypothetical protein